MPSKQCVRLIFITSHVQIQEQYLQNAAVKQSCTVQESGENPTSLAHSSESYH